MEAGLLTTLMALLHKNHTGRLAYEAADLLETLTRHDPDHSAVLLEIEPLQDLISLIWTLLQAAGALSSTDAGAPAIQVAPHADDTAPLMPVLTRLGTLKHASSPAESSAAPQMPSQSTERHQPLSPTCSVEAKAGSAAILTRPDGQCSEVAVPQSPSTASQTGLISPTQLGSQQKGAKLHASSSQLGPIPVTLMSGQALSHPGPDGTPRSNTASRNWFHGFLTRLGSVSSHNSSELETHQQQLGTNQALLTAKSLSLSTAFSRELAHIDSVTSDLPAAAVVRRTRPSSHASSHAVLRSAVMSMANVASSNSVAQQALIQLGAVSLSQEVLSLAGKEKLDVGLATASAALVRSLSSGSPAAQQAFGTTGAIGQLLTYAQVIGHVWPSMYYAIGVANCHDFVPGTSRTLQASMIQEAVQH